MNRRGISPLIATVLIIGFTVALAAVIITWGTRFVQQTQEDVDVSTQIGLACSKLNFDIVRIECVGGGLTGDLLNITINSNSDEDIAGFTFRSTTNTGVLVDTANKALPLSGFNTWEYTWTGGASTNPTRVEAIAHVTVAGVTQVCQAGIEKVETTNVCGFTA